MANFVIDITEPPESAMAVDIIVSDNPLTVETVGMASNLSVDVMTQLPMAIEMVAGSIKGDKGDPGGTAISKVASTALAGHRIVVLNLDGTISYASSAIAEHANRVYGVTKSAVEAGASVDVQLLDTMEEPTWSWIPDKPIYLKVDGLMTQDYSQTVLFLLAIGTALTATSILIDKQIPIFN